MTTAKAPSNPRRATLIKLIQVARRDLGRLSGLDDLAYRDILRIVGKSESLAAMTVPNMELVLAHMKSKGFVVRPKTGDRRQTINPDASKVRALWLFLHALGEVRDPSEKALATYVKRIAKVDDLRWALGDAVTALIETMKKWAMRFLPQAVKELAPQVGALPLSDVERGQLNAVLNKAFSRLTFDPMHSAWESLTDVLKKGR